MRAAQRKEPERLRASQVGPGLTRATTGENVQQTLVGRGYSDNTGDLWGVGEGAGPELGSPCGRAATEARCPAGRALEQGGRVPGRGSCVEPVDRH